MALKKKIVLLGDSAVGKTSLIKRYVFDQFEHSYISTVGSKVTKKKLMIPGPNRTESLTFLIWDVIGREGFHALHSRTFIGIHGAILVADLTRKETLESLERYWIPFLFKVVEKTQMVFVCNKSDLKDDYQYQLGDLEDIAKRYDGVVTNVLGKRLKQAYSTSARDGTNVEKAFETLGHLVVAEHEREDPVRKICEILRATRIRRNSDKTTPIGALDAIIVNIFEDIQDSRVATLILRQEIARAGVDINDPKKERLYRLVEYLADAEMDFLTEEKVLTNLVERKKMVENIC
jgi:small GTP-binding protein